jgi:hypothetical protein
MIYYCNWCSGVGAGRPEYCYKLNMYTTTPAKVHIQCWVGM